jgi:hypothetical protein
METAKLYQFPTPAPIEQERETSAPRTKNPPLSIDLIRDLAPRQGVYIQFCGEQKGLGIKVMPSGLKTVIFEKREQNKKNKTRVTLDRIVFVNGVMRPKMKDIREWAEEQRTKVHRVEPITKTDIYAAAHPPTEKTVGEAFPPYKANRTSKQRKRLPWAQKTVEHYDAMMRVLAPARGTEDWHKDSWHDRSIFSITKAEVVKRFDELEAELGSAVTRLHFQLFGALFNFTAADLDPSPASPTCVLTQKEMWPQLEDREGYITEKVFPQWWRVLDHIPNPTWALYYRMLVLTGCRRTELLHAKWEWYKDGVLTLPATVTKGRRDHAIPIGPRLAKMLAAHRKTQAAHGQIQFIFAHPVSGRRLRRPDAAARRLQAKHPILNSEGSAWTRHDLRRTYESIAHGIPAIPFKAQQMLINHSLSTMAAKLGSKSAETTLGYIQIEDLAKYQRLIEDAIFKRAKVR